MVSDGPGWMQSAYTLRGMGAGSNKAGIGVQMFIVGRGSCELHLYNKLLFPVHIQANLEDELVKEALKTVRLSTILTCPPPHLPSPGREKDGNSLLCLYPGVSPAGPASILLSVPHCDLLLNCNVCSPGCGSPSLFKAGGAGATTD